MRSPYVKAQVKITNLGSKSAYVVVRDWIPFSSNSGGLAVITEAGWVFKGWREIPPGGTYHTKSNKVLYVKYNGRPATWKNLKTSRGLVKPGEKFTSKLRKNHQEKDGNKALRDGFKWVDFMQFKKGSYTISGDKSFRIAKKRFNFQNESRSTKFITDSFPVDGQVVDYYHNVTKKWAKGINWKRNKRSVSLNGSVSGKQVTAFGAREPGKYSGYVDVEYTVRR